MAVALFGGAFDPPHVGHVALLQAAKARFAGARFVVLVSQDPGHKQVDAPAAARLELARAAFPDDEVRPDPHRYTIDLLRAEDFDDPLVVVGADELEGFLSWREPLAVLERARLAVATRPGVPRDRLDAVLEALDGAADRVVCFEIPPSPLASRDVRALAAAGAPLTGLVPDAVAALIRKLGLYRALDVRGSGLD